MNIIGAARPLIQLALEEDLGDSGDVTTDAVVPRNARAVSRLVAREAGVLAGLDIARAVFADVDPGIRFETHLADGAAVEAGRLAATVSGPARGILTGERVALNFMQRLSGVATMARRFVAAVEGTGVRVIDTRKTTPGFRRLEKYAVTLGGGENHRHGLWDRVLIKDNHVAVAGSVAEAVKRSAGARARGLLIEVEVTTMGEALEALEAGADILLLDNMTPAEVGEAVRHVEAGGEPKPAVEVSGGINLKTIRSYALPGVDFISVGALTHSAPALDLALDFELVPAGRRAR